MEVINTYIRNDLNMERVLIFEMPMSLDYVEGAKDKSEIRKPAFGILLPEVSYSHYTLSEYVAYLYAAQKWDELGGDVDFDNWTTKEGDSYFLLDDEIRDFIDKSISERPFSATIYEVGFDVADGIIHTFVADERVARRIREEGNLVDVLKVPYREDVGEE